VRAGVRRRVEPIRSLNRCIVDNLRQRGKQIVVLKLSKQVAVVGAQVLS